MDVRTGASVTGANGVASGYFEHTGDETKSERNVAANSDFLVSRGSLAGVLGGVRCGGTGDFLY